MRMVVMPRVGYTGQGANLTDAQIKKLDSVTLGYARKDLKLLAGFPTAPLVHHQLINHPLPSSIYYEARLGSLWRNLGRAGRPSVIIQEHLDRALRTRGMDPNVAQPLQMIDTQPVDGGSYWINMAYWQDYKDQSYTYIEVEHRQCNPPLGSYFTAHT